MTAKLRYDGPPDQAIAGVGALVPGTVYELEDEMAKSLAGGRHWTPVGWDPPVTKLPSTHKALDELADQHQLTVAADATVAEKQAQLSAALGIPLETEENP